jgi:hypothetical protein
LQRKSRTRFAEQSINDKRPGNLSSAFFHSLCFKEEYQTARQPLRGLLETQSRRVHGVSIPEPKPSSLCLRVSVFQRRVSDRAPTIARTLETRSHRVHRVSSPEPKPSSLCLRVSVFQKTPQIKQPTLRGLWKHGVTEFTERLVKRHQQEPPSGDEWLPSSLCLCVSVFQKNARIVGRGSRPASPHLRISIQYQHLHHETKSSHRSS